MIPPFDITGGTVDQLQREREYWANPRFSQEEYEIVCGQAISEMINDYRVANGLAPMRTHVKFEMQSKAWSKSMAARSNFVHSDAKQWGRSGENIAARYGSNYNPEAMRAKDWGQLANDLFHQWRDSPGHNQNMLESVYQGVGVGVHIDDEGDVWATTMFFIEDTALTNAGQFTPDLVTRNALSSSDPFFMPKNAKQILEQEHWRAPSTPNGATVDNGKIRGGYASQLSKTYGLNAGVDRRINLGKLPNTRRVAEIDNTLPRARSRHAESIKRLNNAKSNRTDAAQELRDATDSHNSANGYFDRTGTSLTNAISELERSEADRDRAVDIRNDLPENPPAPAEYLLVESDTAESEAESRQQSVAIAKEQRDRRQSALKRALEKVDSASKTFDEVMFAQPQLAPSPESDKSERASWTETGDGNDSDILSEAFKGGGGYNPTFNRLDTATPATSDSTSDNPKPTAEEVPSDQPDSYNPTFSNDQQPAANNAPQQKHTATADEGSSADTVVGVILALLAVVGIIAAVATNMQK